MEREQSIIGRMADTSDTLEKGVKIAGAVGFGAVSAYGAGQGQMVDTLQRAAQLDTPDKAVVAKSPYQDNSLEGYMTAMATPVPEKTGNVEQIAKEALALHEWTLGIQVAKDLADAQKYEKDLAAKQGKDTPRYYDANQLISKAGRKELEADHPANKLPQSVLSDKQFEAAIVENNKAMEGLVASYPLLEGSQGKNATKGEFGIVFVFKQNQDGTVATASLVYHYPPEGNGKPDYMYYNQKGTEVLSPLYIKPLIDQEAAVGMGIKNNEFVLTVKDKNGNKANISAPDENGQLSLLPINPKDADSVATPQPVDNLAKRAEPIAPEAVVVETFGPKVDFENEDIKIVKQGGRDRIIQVGGQEIDITQELRMVGIVRGVKMGEVKPNQQNKGYHDVPGYVVSSEIVDLPLRTADGGYKTVKFVRLNLSVPKRDTGKDIKVRAYFLYEVGAGLSKEGINFGGYQWKNVLPEIAPGTPVIIEAGNPPKTDSEKEKVQKRWRPDVVEDIFLAANAFIDDREEIRELASSKASPDKVYNLLTNSNLFINVDVSDKTPPDALLK